ncbi:hypothetical protein SERLADRAFT_433485 [Serpula lacrymans var. lacrymans S7.9]|uniref:Fungal-type protein kinase domain-containing protein n=1 Tax=Serpula lacrymans var. lacrymans (strain S7.9) TaxID=578457 RepID=F8NIF6_SERL9|nr:uncharacterized protein SERLADRAFT_433485 [Serpula lacrymans var. lacrymans S7.9]EGO29505.1 hypothetical protein SERLADRAFT_433485 [Serpula lacrymans var. lacrymans S7.9]
MATLNHPYSLEGFPIRRHGTPPTKPKFNAFLFKGPKQYYHTFMDPLIKAEAAPLKNYCALEDMLHILFPLSELFPSTPGALPQENPLFTAFECLQQEGLYSSDLGKWTAASSCPDLTKPWSPGSEGEVADFLNYLVHKVDQLVDSGTFKRSRWWTSVYAVQAVGDAGGRRRPDLVLISSSDTSYPPKLPPASMRNADSLGELKDQEENKASFDKVHEQLMGRLSFYQTFGRVNGLSLFLENNVSEYSAFMIPYFKRLCKVLFGSTLFLLKRFVEAGPPPFFVLSHASHDNVLDILGEALEESQRNERWKDLRRPFSRASGFVHHLDLWRSDDEQFAFQAPLVSSYVSVKASNRLQAVTLQSLKRHHNALSPFLASDIADSKRPHTKYIHCSSFSNLTKCLSTVILLIHAQHHVADLFPAPVPSICTLALQEAVLDTTRDGNLERQGLLVEENLDTPYGPPHPFQKESMGDAVEDIEEDLFAFIPLKQPEQEDLEPGEAAGPSNHPNAIFLNDNDDEHVEILPPTAGQIICMDHTLHGGWGKGFEGARRAVDNYGDVDMDNNFPVASGPQDTRFFPFASETDWRVACWAIQDGIGHKSFDRLLAIPGVCFYSIHFLDLLKEAIISGQRETGSCHNIRGLHKIVDSGIPSRADWTSKTIAFPDAPDDKHLIHYRDVISAICSLLGNPAHAKHIVYKPKKIFSNAQKENRYYNEMWTGKWWHAI